MFGIKRGFEKLSKIHEKYLPMGSLINEVTGLIYVFTKIGRHRRCRATPLKKDIIASVFCEFYEFF